MLHRVSTGKFALLLAESYRDGLTFTSGVGPTGGSVCEAMAILGIKDGKWAATDSLTVNVSLEPFVHDKACCNCPRKGLASSKGNKRWWPPPKDEWYELPSPPSKQCGPGCLQRWCNTVAYAGYVLAVAMALSLHRGPVFVGTMSNSAHNAASVATDMLLEAHAANTRQEALATAASPAPGLSDARQPAKARAPLHISRPRDDTKHIGAARHCTSVAAHSGVCNSFYRLFEDMATFFDCKLPLKRDFLQRLQCVNIYLDPRLLLHRRAVEISDQRQAVEGVCSSVLQRVRLLIGAHADDTVDFSDTATQIVSQAVVKQEYEKRFPAGDALSTALAGDAPLAVVEELEPVSCKDDDSSNAKRPAEAQLVDDRAPKLAALSTGATEDSKLIVVIQRRKDAEQLAAAAYRFAQERVSRLRQDDPTIQHALQRSIVHGTGWRQCLARQFDNYVLRLLLHLRGQPRKLKGNWLWKLWRQFLDNTEALPLSKVRNFPLVQVYCC